MAGAGREGAGGPAAARAAAIARIRRSRAFRVRLGAAAVGMLVLYPTVVWLLGIGEAARAAIEARPVPEARIARELRRRRA